MSAATVGSGESKKESEKDIPVSQTEAQSLEETKDSKKEPQTACREEKEEEKEEQGQGEEEKQEQRVEQKQKKEKEEEDELNKLDKEELTMKLQEKDSEVKVNQSIMLSALVYLRIFVELYLMNEVEISDKVRGVCVFVCALS